MQRQSQPEEVAEEALSVNIAVKELLMEFATDGVVDKAAIQKELVKNIACVFCPGFLERSALHCVFPKKQSLPPLPCVGNTDPRT